MLNDNWSWTWSKSPDCNVKVPTAIYHRCPFKRGHKFLLTEAIVFFYLLHKRMKKLTVYVLIGYQSTKISKQKIYIWIVCVLITRINLYTGLIFITRRYYDVCKNTMFLCTYVTIHSRLRCNFYKLLWSLTTRRAMSSSAYIHKRIPLMLFECKIFYILYSFYIHYNNMLFPIWIPLNSQIVG